MSIKTKKLYLDIDVESHKNPRGRILSYTARLAGDEMCKYLEASGPTEQAAIADLAARIRCMVSGAGRVAIVSEPHVGYHAIAMLGASGHCETRNLTVQNDVVAVSGCISDGAPTFDETVRRMRANARHHTHRQCALCHVEKVWELLTYYTTLTNTTLGVKALYPYYVCNTCEDVLGLGGTLTQLKHTIPLSTRVWRIGVIESSGQHPKIPQSAIDEFLAPQVS